MQNSFFSIDFLALIIASIICFVFFLLRKWSKKFLSPHLKYSDLKALLDKHPELQSKKISSSEICLVASLFCFLLAFIDPHFNGLKEQKTKDAQPLKQTPTEGIAIYFVLDRSGSMASSVKAYVDGSRQSISKVDLLKKLTSEFIEKRPNDLIGLTFFARTAQVEVPLTLDHKEILNVLDGFKNVTDEKDDGTAIGYAIYKTASLIAETRHYAEGLIQTEKPSYSIKSSVIILVTDGFQSPSPLDEGNRFRNIDLVEAADYARRHNIRLYIINVDPAMSSQEYVGTRTLMKKVAELTKGDYFLVDNDANLGKIYQEIDRLEKSRIPIEEQFKQEKPALQRTFSFYPAFIALGLCFLAVFCLLETLFMRRIP